MLYYYSSIIILYKERDNILNTAFNMLCSYMLIGHTYKQRGNQTVL